MTGKEFERIVHERCEKAKAMLVRKAKEYARGDRLSNFKVAAAYLGCTPERALQGLRIKHDVSIKDLVDDLDRGQLAPLDVWEEKIGDDINYLILLEGMVRERHKAAQP